MPRPARCTTIDGRETAPRGHPERRVHRPGDRQALQLHARAGHQRRVASASPARSRRGRRRSTGWARGRLDEALKPAIQLATARFMVDETFRQQTADNQARFAAFPRPASCSCPAASRPRSASIFKNPDLADDLPAARRQGHRRVLRGRARRRDRARPCRSRRRRPDHHAARPPGLHDDRATSPTTGLIEQEPTQVGYRGLDVYGMAPSSQRRHDGRRGAEHPRELRPLAR